MSYILSIESATPVLSVALHQDGKLITNIEHHLAQSHSRVLMDIIDHILKSNGITLQELSAIAISTGPGSYTGLRVGLSFAKGICLGSGLPLIAIDTLLSMIEAVRTYPIKGVYCALLDARKGNAYGLLTDASGQILAPTQKYSVRIASFQKWLEKDLVYFIGSGAEHYRKELENHANSHFVQNINPRASHMGKIAHMKFTKREFVDRASFEPCYY